ncbi:MAG: hypothetical protein FWE67_08165 [Planctomycetaceae bacterium]|nr:hypothetical protein [Planctomycetaceae bacterium]
MTIRTRFLVAAVLTVLFVFAGWAFARNTPDAAVAAFFEHFEAGHYEKISELCDNNMQKEWFPGRARDKDDVYDVDPWSSIFYAAKHVAAGEYQGVDTPQRKESPGGPIWESALRFKNTAFPFRVAVDDQGKIAAMEFYGTTKSPILWDFDYPRIGLPLLAQRFGHDYSLLVELLGSDDKPFQIVFAQTMLYRQVNQVPDVNIRFFTDPADRTLWCESDDRQGYSTTDWEKDILCLRRLAKGTYRLAMGIGISKKKSAVVFSSPITFDETAKERKITVCPVPSGTLCVSFVDVETGKRVDGAGAYLTSASVPPNIFPEWLDLAPGLPMVYEFLLSGRYEITPHYSSWQPGDPVYTPEEKYEVTITGGDDVKIVTKLRARPHTAEEINTRWPFVVSGTVRDENGKPLEQAKVTVQRNDILVGFRVYTGGGGPLTMTTMADAEGKFLLRFNPAELASSHLVRKLAPLGNSDCMGILLEAEKPGFTKNGRNFVCVDPEPSDSANVVYWKTEKRIAADEMLFAKTPKELNIVMEPSIMFRGNVVGEDTRSKLVVLKFDDVAAGTGGQVVSGRWQRMADYLEGNKIKGSFGVIGYSLVEDNPAYFKWITDRAKRGTIEFWNHGFHFRKRNPDGTFEPQHAVDEFLRSYDEQLYSLCTTDRLAKEKLGLDFPVWGPHWSGANTDTDRALAQMPQILMTFGFPLKTEHYKGFVFRNRINFEFPVGNPVFDNFKKAYEAQKDSMEYFFIQGHPAQWETETKWENFFKTIEFLKAEGVRFVAPSELLKILNTKGER